MFSTALIAAAIQLIISSNAWGQFAEGVIDGDPTGAQYAAGELLVTYKDDVSERATGSVEQKAGAEVEEEVPEIDTQLLELPEIEDEQAEAVRERELERVKQELEADPAATRASAVAAWQARTSQAL